MRGNDDQLQSGMFSYVSLEERIPTAHPLRGVRKLADTVLADMSKDFDGMYAKVGGPRFRRSGYFVHCYCRSSIPLGVNGC